MSQAIGRLNLIPVVGLALISILIASCSDSAEVVRYRTPKPVQAPETPVAAAPTSSEHSHEITWAQPEGWGEGRASSMRVASFAVPFEGGDPADVSLTKLGGMAGGLLANVNRWRGQIALDPVGEVELGKSVEGRKTTAGAGYVYLELENEEQKKAIYGAIYEGHGFFVFAKMTASLESARNAKDQFKEFCDSVGLGH